MSDKKRYNIFRMRNGGHGNQVLFPETHADAVHTTKQRMFVNAAEKKTINMMVGSPLLDFNEEDQKTKFDQLFELADNIQGLKRLMNDVNVDDFNRLMYQMEQLSPLLSPDTLQQLLNLLDQPSKYDLAVVPGNDGEYYTLSVRRVTDEDGVEHFEESYAPFKPSLVNPTIGAIYTPKSYVTGQTWKVPLGVENLKIKIPLTQAIVVKDNSLRNNQIDIWTDIIHNDDKLKVDYYSDLVGSIRFDPAENASPYAWMVWNVQAFLKKALQINYQKDDVSEEYQNLLNKLVNFEEKVTYRPLQTGGVTMYQPYIDNQLYEGHIESNGDSTLLLEQSIIPQDVNMSMGLGNINTDYLLNGDKGTIASILKTGEECSFEFEKPELILEFENPFKGKTLEAINSSDKGFKLEDWKIVTE